VLGSGGGLSSWIKVSGSKHNTVDDGGHELPERNLVPPAEEASPSGAEVRRVMAVGCFDELEAVALRMEELVLLVMREEEALTEMYVGVGGWLSWVRWWVGRHSGCVW